MHRIAVRALDFEAVRADRFKMAPAGEEGVCRVRGHDMRAAREEPNERIPVGRALHDVRRRHDEERLVGDGRLLDGAAGKAAALQLLGTTVSVSVGNENGSIGFQSTTGKFSQALDILADMLVNPAFPADALERLRAQRLVALTQGKDQPADRHNRDKRVAQHVAEDDDPVA